jgi:hypothetical protein
VLKKNGKFIICVNFQKLIVTIKKDLYPLPFIDEKLKIIACHNAYSFLDGYFNYDHIYIYNTRGHIQNNFCNILRSIYMGSYLELKIDHQLTKR